MTGLSGINYSLSILIKLYTNLIILIVIEAWRIYRRYLDFKPFKTSSQSTRNINNNNTTQTAAAACRKVKKWVCSETGREDDSQRKIKTEMLFAPLNAQHVMSATRGLTIKTRVDFIVIIHYNNIDNNINLNKNSDFSENILRNVRDTVSAQTNNISAAHLLIFYILMQKCYMTPGLDPFSAHTAPCTTRGKGWMDFTLASGSVCCVLLSKHEQPLAPKSQKPAGLHP